MMGSGRMWLAPAALEDPRAVRMTMTAQGLPTEAIVQRYIPQVRQPGCTCKVALTIVVMTRLTRSIMQRTVWRCCVTCRR